MLHAMRDPSSRSKGWYALGWLILILALISLIACGSPATAVPPSPTVGAQAPTTAAAPKAANPIVIGFDGVMSGANALNGQLSVNGSILAVEEINMAGGVNVPKEGPRPFKLITEDDKNSPDAAVSAVNKLVFEDKAFAILGPDFGNIVVATLKLCQQNKFLQFYSTLSSATTKEGTYCETSFRNRSEDTYWAQVLVDYMVDDLHLTKIATSYQNFEFGITGNDMVVKQLAKRGLKPVITVTHEVGDKDLTPSAAKIFAANPEAVINWGLQAQQALLVQELRKLGWQGVIGSPVADSIFVDVAGKAAEGVIGPQNWVYTDPGDKGKVFTDKFRARFNMAPDSHSPGYYDAVYLLKYAIEKVGLDTQAVQKFISTLDQWDGIQGTYTPSKLTKGQLITTVSMIKIVNGQPVVLKTYK